LIAFGALGQAGHFRCALGTSTLTTTHFYKHFVPTSLFPQKTPEEGIKLKMRVMAVDAGVA
jgi:hypothetical protein